MNRVIRLFVCLVMLGLSLEVSAENWPGWRGPRGDGTSLDTAVPTQWSESENLTWKVAIPGVGHASPVIWGDRIFVVSYVPQEEQRRLICLDRHSGKQRWAKVVLTSPPQKKHRLNSHASSTPVTDGELVYVIADKDLDRADRGVTTVIRPGPTLDIVAENTLDEPIYASPAVYKGQLFLRAERHLYCIGTK